MWLLDANMDVHLASILTGLEINCDTAENRGWKALSNGDLVKAAVDARDHLFGEAASRVLKLFPQFAVVVVNIPQRRWTEYRERFVARWIERPIEPVAGLPVIPYYRRLSLARPRPTVTLISGFAPLRLAAHSSGPILREVRGGTVPGARIRRERRPLLRPPRERPLFSSEPRYASESGADHCGKDQQQGRTA